MAERSGAEPEPPSAPRRDADGAPATGARRGAAGAAGGGAAPASPATAAPGRRNGVLRPLLAVPLYYKILIANAVLVALSAGGGILLARDWLRGEPGAWTWPVALAVAGVAVLLSVVVNGVILRVALQPLEELEHAAARVQAGELAARAPMSPLADRELEHLISTFNGMLEALAGYRQQLRRLAAQALGAEEEERKRIARELHDDTAQIMASLLIRLRVAQRATDPVQRDGVLEEVREGLAQALDGVRRYARGLRPPALDELGLVPAIEAYAREVTEASGLALEVREEPIEGLLSPEAELALYRIVQEALTNACRHARATRVRVSVARADHRVVASVEDDGRGFNVEDALGAGHRLGLFGMRERASYVGGNVEVTSELGVGTRITAAVPTREGEQDA